MATVVILEGDETGQELLAEALRVLQPGVTGAPLEFVAFDLSLPARTRCASAPCSRKPRTALRRGWRAGNIANPMAMILAGAAMLAYVDDPASQRASRAIYEATFHAVSRGVRTVDRGGDASTTEFTDEVIRLVRDRVGVGRRGGGQGI
ncbi:MAG TPA: isocitrate/isopropylmalate family dehydrogenase [bacterium]|nr:isocitrate/isopropylmalate family dehydrogenase [bacterium]